MHRFILLLVTAHDDECDSQGRSAALVVFWRIQNHTLANIYTHHITHMRRTQFGTRAQTRKQRFQIGDDESSSENRACSRADAYLEQFICMFFCLFRLVCVCCATLTATRYWISIAWCVHTIVYLHVCFRMMRGRCIFFRVVRPLVREIK